MYHITLSRYNNVGVVTDIAESVSLAFRHWKLCACLVCGIVQKRKGDK